MLEMYIKPPRGGLVSFQTRTIFEVSRDPVMLRDPALPRSEESVDMCPWCHRLRMPDWTEMEEANERIVRDHAGRLPMLSYTIREADSHRFAVLFESLKARQ